MKILVVGDWHSELHEQAVFNAFKILGHEVSKFAWHDYFRSSNRLDTLCKKLQNRLIVGPVVWKLNQDLIDTAVEFSPDLIFVYRGTHITAGTLKKIKQLIPDSTLVGYNNDDPFAKGHPYSLWRHFFKAVPVYDLMFAYRHHNLDDLLRIGAKRVELLRSWYIPEFHKKMTPSKRDELKYGCDCIFVGHFEEDGRDACIEELINSGVNVKIFGPYSGLGKSGWDTPVARSVILQRVLPIEYLSGDSYVTAINCAPIALCFLSKLNKDTYTRRCFEIPAIGAALFSEYTEDLASLFKDGEEAVFFRSKEELLEKVLYFLEHKDQLDEIRKRGMARVKHDGHDIYSRLNAVINLVS